MRKVKNYLESAFVWSYYLVLICFGAALFYGCFSKAHQKFKEYTDTKAVIIIVK